MVKDPRFHYEPIQRRERRPDKYWGLERIRDYPDCFQDCPDISECKMKDSWKQTRLLKIKSDKYCQMTIGEYDFVSGDAGYSKCSKPAKYKIPHPKMGVEYVCGIHANSLNKMFKRIGSEEKCERLSG